jgi:NAD-dependent dihydropyrimidine dehydrogenase PreA subunit
VNAVDKSEDKVYTIIQEKCIKCGACFTACPEKFAAVIKVPAYTIQKQPAGAGTLPGTKA